MCMFLICANFITLNLIIGSQNIYSSKSCHVAGIFHGVNVIATKLE